MPPVTEISQKIAYIQRVHSPASFSVIVRHAQTVLGWYTYTLNSKFSLQKNNNFASTWELEEVNTVTDVTITIWRTKMADNFWARNFINGSFCRKWQTHCSQSHRINFTINKVFSRL